MSHKMGQHVPNFATELSTPPKLQTKDMKKIVKLHWNNYKNSDSGKEVIAAFDKLTDPDATVEDLYELACRFDPECFNNSSENEKKNDLKYLDFLDSEIREIRSEIDKLGQEGAYIDYKALSCFLFCNDIEAKYDDIPQATIKSALGSNLLLSLMLSCYFPSYYIPNLFPMQFIYLKKIAEKYEIDLPTVPNRSDYRSRWLYYDEMCNAFNQFATENDLDSLSELCAFLYDYEMTVIKEEMEGEHNKPMPKVPEQAWIIVGNYGEAERTMKEGFWQSSPFTSKGDVLVFYEKSPVKKLNSVWTALEDGFIDPFGPYYSYSVIGNKIEIPDEMAISYADFKASDYFTNRDNKGNFVSKNFQDVSGWEVNFEDYAEIKRILEAKGFDISILPQLYEPIKVGDVKIEREQDVSDQLLIPLLEQMGWKKDVDFKAEVEFNAGRGKTGHSSEKRPDFLLHIVETKDDIEAKVAIEVKHHMKNEKEVHDNFVQGRSYAKWGAVQVLVLCDMKRIRVYKRNKNNRFDENNYIEFSWKDTENHDQYIELKKLLS